MNENEARLDEAAAKVAEIETQIGATIAKKEVATKDGDRKAFDRALADLEFLGSRKTHFEKEYQRVRAEADASTRATKLAELEEARGAADRDAALGEIRELIADAATRILEFRGIQTRALEIAATARAHAERANQIARELGIISITASVDETEIERAFTRMLKEQS